MNQAGAVFIGLAAIVVLAVLWVREVQRERQLRAAQGERVVKSLREALLRENSADPGRNVGIPSPPLYPALVRGAQPSHGVELSLVLFSPRHSGSPKVALTGRDGGTAPSTGTRGIAEEIATELTRKRIRASES